MRAKCEPMFHWEPVSRLVRWVGDKPVWETPYLDDLQPDYMVQIAAARRYLENHEPAPVKVNVTWPVNVGIVLVLIGVLGLLTAMVGR